MLIRVFEGGAHMLRQMRELPVRPRAPSGARNRRDVPVRLSTTPAGPDRRDVSPPEALHASYPGGWIEIALRQRGKPVRSCPPKRRPDEEACQHRAEPTGTSLQLHGSRSKKAATEELRHKRVDDPGGEGAY